MRFQVTQVMDAIEHRLTTDVTLAQAVVDLGQVVRDDELDQGRPVSLVRAGMVIDALSRHLVDDGAMLYGVVDRPLLSEGALTSKERMVLGRWADDGLIEVVPVMGDRVIEIADVTGLPVIAVSPYREYAGRYGWLANGAGRVLMLGHRGGVAVLKPLPERVDRDPDLAEVVVGRAKVPEHAEPAERRPAAAEPTAGAEPPAEGVAAEAAPVAAAADKAKAAADTAEAAEAAEPTDPAASAEPETGTEAGADAGPGGEPAPGPAPEPAAVAEPPAANAEPQATEPEATEPAPMDPAGAASAAGSAAKEMPLPAVSFGSRGVLAVVRTRISSRRFRVAEPNATHAKLLGRQWRCDEFECPVFGEHRRIGQPVPRLRDGVPVCPRHDRPVVDIGPREPSYPISIVVDDLPRRRLVVRRGRPVVVGSAAADPDEPDLVSVADWLHRAAAAWISEQHLRLESDDDGLTVTDLSGHGTVVWERTGPDGPATARTLRRDAARLGEWDSVELYTGIELMRGDRRLAAVLGRDELSSVLLDAPTAAHHRVSGART